MHFIVFSAEIKTSQRISRYIENIDIWLDDTMRHHYIDTATTCRYFDISKHHYGCGRAVVAAAGLLRSQHALYDTAPVLKNRKAASSVTNPRKTNGQKWSGKRKRKSTQARRFFVGHKNSQFRIEAGTTRSLFLRGRARFVNSVGIVDRELAIGLNIPAWLVYRAVGRSCCVRDHVQWSMNGDSSTGRPPSEVSERLL